jgi:hypothetical protein
MPVAQSFHNQACFELLEPFGRHFVFLEIEPLPPAFWDLAIMLCALSLEKRASCEYVLVLLRASSALDGTVVELEHEPWEAVSNMAPLNERRWC